MDNSIYKLMMSIWCEINHIIFIRTFGKTCILNKISVTMLAVL